MPANQIVGLLAGRNVRAPQRGQRSGARRPELSVRPSSLRWTCSRVRHVIVCGHYGCGGVLAALRDDKLGLVDNWLRHVQDVRWKHQAQLDALETETERHNRLCELNVIEQVVNVSQTTVVRDAWAEGRGLRYTAGFTICRTACCATWVSASPMNLSLHCVRKPHDAGLSDRPRPAAVPLLAVQPQVLAFFATVIS